jgi:hypothetical protein
MSMSARTFTNLKQTHNYFKVINVSKHELTGTTKKQRDKANPSPHQRKARKGICSSGI